MEKTGPWAAIYFIFLMAFGNYVLFNLLVAILVDGISEQVPKNRIPLFFTSKIDKMKLILFR
jgi:hypothetical protein